jgi:hypothetical protein
MGYFTRAVKGLRADLAEHPQTEGVKSRESVARI